MRNAAALIALTASILSASQPALAAPTRAPSPAPSKEEKVARAAITVYDGMASQLMPMLKSNQLRPACKKIRSLGLAQDVFKDAELGAWVSNINKAAFRAFLTDAALEDMDTLREYCRGRASHVAAFNAAEQLLSGTTASIQDIQDEAKFAAAEALVATTEYPQLEAWSE